MYCVLCCTRSNAEMWILSAPLDIAGTKGVGVGIGDREEGKKERGSHAGYT